MSSENVSIHVVCVMKGEGKKPMWRTFTAESSVKNLLRLYLVALRFEVTLPKLGDTIFKTRRVKLQKTREGKHSEGMVTLLECKFGKSIKTFLVTCLIVD